MFANLSAKKFLCISFVIACLFAGSRAGFADDTADQNKPKVISINPPPDSKMALLSELKITFDQPMMPEEFNVVDASVDKNNPRSNVGIILPFCSYDANTNTFTLLLALPGNWNGQVRLFGFKNVDGVETNDVVVDYHTLKDGLSKDLLARFEKEKQSTELRELLKKIKEARAGIVSLSEKVNWTIDRGDYKETESIVIKMNTGGRFFLDMNGMFKNKWKIGCDGNQCWSYYVTGGKEDHLVKEDLKDINKINISICDLFGLNKKDIDEILRSNNLEYGGTSLYDGQKCYVIRSWTALASTVYTACYVDEWLVEGKNYMPVQMTRFYTRDRDIYEYSYDSVNMPIPDSEFKPDSLTDVPGISEPLGEGYDKRFIRVIDGTSYGNMSFSWGKSGPKGTASGGLN
jgi:outer membrane lipoprotein-sorting protein